MNHAARILALTVAATVCASATPSRASFTDVAATAGVGVTINGTGREDWGYGAAFFDFDNDGDLDLYVASEAGRGNWLFRNDSGSFTDVAAAAGVADLGNGRGVKVADFNNDGDEDFFLANHRGANRLYRNNGDGTFADVADSALASGNLTFGAAWGDYDRDGFVDLYVVNRREANQLFHNRGDGTFAEVGAALGVDDDKAGLEAVWLDYDNDGDADLYLSNDKLTGNRLWCNNDDGTFTDVSAASGANAAINSMGVAVGDYDNDGWLDLYLTDTTCETLCSDIGNILYHNNGDGTFTNVAALLGCRVDRYSWGAAFLDHDNDGNLDLYVVDWGANQSLQATNALFVNSGGGPFNDEAASTGTDDNSPGFGLAVGDYNGDGWPDMFITNNELPSVLYRNTPGTNHWLRIRTVGVQSNRDGIGARVRVKTGLSTRIREVSGGSSYLCDNEKTVSFGLGGLLMVDEVEVIWPSGTVDRFSNVATNQTLTIVEGTSGALVVRPRLSLDPNFPNPFNPATTIAFSVAVHGRVVVDIYDGAGRRVRTIVDSDFDAGRYERPWDGTDDSGNRMPTGVYFCRLSSAGEVISRKMVLVK